MPRGLRRVGAAIVAVAVGIIAPGRWHPAVMSAPAVSRLPRFRADGPARSAARRSRRIEQDDRQASPEERELVALARGAATLLLNASARAAVGQAQQLVEEIEQLVAALDHERVQQHEHERVPACGR